LRHVDRQHARKYQLLRLPVPPGCRKGQNAMRQWIRHAPLFLLVLLTSKPSSAIGVGGYAGSFVLGGSDSDDGLTIGESYGALELTSTNTSDWMYWEVALGPIDAGTYNPSFGVLWPYGNPMSNYIGCGSYSQTQLNTGNAYESTGLTYTSATNGPTCEGPSRW